MKKKRTLALPDFELLKISYIIIATAQVFINSVGLPESRLCLSIIIFF